MDGRVWFRVLAAFVLLALIAGIGITAYNAGVATHVQLPAATNGQAPVYPYYGFGFWHPFWFFGFGLIGPLIGLFLLILVVRVFLFALFGARWGRWGRMHRGWRNWDDGDDVPPMFREWHDRAHGRPTQPDDASKS